MNEQNRRTPPVEWKSGGPPSGKADSEPRRRTGPATRGRAGSGLHRRNRRQVKPWNQRIAPYLFVLPNMVIFGVFIIYPAINGFNISAYDSSNGRTFRPVGTGNYEKLFSDAEFWTAATATAIFVAVFVVLSTAGAIGLALLLEQRVRGRVFFRSAFFLPVLLSPVVVGLLWGWILERRSGALNSVLGLDIGWLVNERAALAATVFVGVWMHIGFYTLIFMAGLQGIDESYYEAARIDGAGPWQRFRHVTWPLLRPTTLVVVILSLITGFQAFDFVYTLTGGGPLGATTLMVQYIYEHAFRSPIQYGLAAAGSVVLFCTIFALTVLSFLYGRRKEAV